ncbi:MAG: hypothetical protein DLM66_11615 [Candidatus Dormiibacter spiritus]|nr:MAG: hypothetical protein DLM66_11615 [Candidatus Dormibacteraeota bacterium]
MYLHGSLATGDFDPAASDIDFLVVTKAELSRAVLARLREMHRQIGIGGTTYANRLEGSYIPLKALRRYDNSNASHPSIGVDWEFGVGHHGPAWVLERHSLSRQGVVVSGPSPTMLIDSVSPRELRIAVTDLLRDFWQRQVDGADWLRPRAYQAFATLTLCRALNMLECGTLVSKRAVEWARQRLEMKWIPHLDRAWQWRHDHTEGDMTETLEFLRYALAQSRPSWISQPEKADMAGRGSRQPHKHQA